MGRPRKQRRPQARAWGRRISTFLGICFAVILTSLIGGTLWAGMRIRRATEGMPTAEVLNRETPGGITQIYSTDKVLLGEIYSKFQERVSFEEIPKALVDATVAVEDKRFYDHPGIDLRGIARAVYKNAREGRKTEGASTLTQQLVRNVILQNRAKTVDRKLQEALLAYQVERSMTKDQILERYLNEVNYGGNIYGVKKAAELYFGKPLKKLTISEAALIAGLVQNPPKTYPFKHLDAAIARRDVVLGTMLETKRITSAEYAAAKAEKVVLQKTPPQVIKFNFKAPYFVNYVLRQMIKRHGKEIVYQGGLKVYTTLNWEMQQKAEEILSSEIRSLHGDGITEGALVTLEPHTGWIRTMVGGVDYEKDKYNFATQGGRQPGSTFKPIVYAAAFQSGRFTPYSHLEDRPIKVGRRYWPKNYGGKNGTGGSISLREALAVSKNTIPAQLIQRVGWRSVVDLAHRMGIQSKMPSNDLSICLGTSNATPLEMANVFSVFANGGNRAEPLAIRLIVDGAGQVLEKNEPLVAKAILSESTTAKIGECLEAVVDHGTGQAAGIVSGARGKTGTTSDNADAWFVGYTKELVTAVWVCNKQMRPRKDKSGFDPVYKPMDSDATGGHKCAPLWGKFMAVAIPIQQRAGLEPIPLPEDAQRLRMKAAGPSPSPKPDMVNEEGEMVITVCRETEKRATPYCPDTEERTFPAGTKIRDCRLHVKKETTDEVVDAATPTPEPRHEPERPPVEAPTRTGALPDTAPTLDATPRRGAPVMGRRLPSAPRSALSDPHTSQDLVDEEEEVTLCAETGKRANAYCPEKVTRRLSKRAKLPVCRVHRPSPGEEERGGH